MNAYSIQWKVGNIIETPTNENNLFQQSIIRGLNRIARERRNSQRFLENTSDFLKDNSINDLALSQICEEDMLKIEEYASKLEEISNDLVKCNSQYIKWIREDIFEKVRAAKFDHLPSRKNGLWLCELKEVEFWWSTIGKISTKKIFEVKINEIGKIHYAEERFLELNSFSIAEFEQNALSYWGGISDSQEGGIEILYEGQLEVVKCYDSLGAWQKVYA
ncbi:MAG: DUF2441 domain-containing protein [Bacteroidota bacterium]